MVLLKEVRNTKDGLVGTTERGEGVPLADDFKIRAIIHIAKREAGDRQVNLDTRIKLWKQRVRNWVKREFRKREGYFHIGRMIYCSHCDEFAFPYNEYQKKGRTIILT